MRRAALAVALLTAVIGSPVVAHAPGARVLANVAPVALQFDYGREGPMAFAEVTVTAPDGRVFQRGRADRQGRYAFVPPLDADDAASWTVLARDGDGHEVSIDVAPGDALVASRYRERATTALGWLALVASVAAVCLTAAVAAQTTWRPALPQDLRAGRIGAALASGLSGWRRPKS